MDDEVKQNDVPTLAEVRRAIEDLSISMRQVRKDTSVSIRKASKKFGVLMPRRGKSEKDKEMSYQGWSNLEDPNVVKKRLPQERTLFAILESRLPEPVKEKARVLSHMIGRVTASKRRRDKRN
jgi:hypothetical protein